jgi:thiol-disulfide isomerase/thioredoxin
MNRVSLSTVTAALLLTAGTALQASDLDDIIKTHNTQKIEAIESYLKATPASEDTMRALDALYTAYDEMGDTKGATKVLGQKYEQGKNSMQVGKLVSTVIHPYFQALLETGQKDEAKALLADARTTFENHAMAAQINQFLDQLKGALAKPTIGDAMEIAFTSVNGDEAINLSEMKEKVVLVDFWATWCGPCIGELPHVKEAYKAYHEKGFEIIGISLDKDVGKLRSFIKEEGMTWPQYFDGKGWGNDLAKKYGISSIPATFLLKDGKIVATNLRGDALSEAIEKHLN